MNKSQRVGMIGCSKCSVLLEGEESVDWTWSFETYDGVVLVVWTVKNLIDI